MQNGTKPDQVKKNNNENISKQQFISKNFLKDVVSSESNIKLESSSKISGNKIKLGFINTNSQQSGNQVNQVNMNNPQINKQIVNKNPTSNSKAKIEKPVEKEKVNKKYENPLRSADNKNKK